MTARAVIWIVLALCAGAVYIAEPGLPFYLISAVMAFEVSCAVFLLRRFGLFEREQETPEAHELRRKRIETKKKSDAKKPLRAEVRY